ncbi:MAG: type II secretion system F family protein [Candidatus Bathyarchaeia archaeon]
MSNPTSGEKPASKKTNKAKSSEKVDSPAPILEKPWYAAYGFLGPIAGPLLPRLKALRSKLVKAGLPVDFRAYVSFMLFGTMAAFVATFSFVVSLALFLLKLENLVFLGIPFTFLAFSALSAGLAAAASFISIYCYPSIMVYVRKNKIEQSLLAAVNYMSILSTAGMSPERIFRSLAGRPEIPGIYEDAKLIVRDIDLFGKDFVSALQDARERSPSRMYSEVLDGFISTIYSGGDLEKYLKDRSVDLMRIQVDSVKTFINRLGLLAESAVAIIAVFPLLFLVIFTMSSILPGGMAGEPIFVYIVLYLILPAISALFLLFMSAGAPKS